MDPHLTALADARPACFWLDRPERPDAEPALERDADADLAIVGGGLTGLWAALLAAEADPSRNIVLVEATRIAEGASGRSGGFADPSLTHGLENGLHHFPDDMDALVQLGRRNFDDLLASLERHGIDPDYEGYGKLEVAPEPARVEDVREHLEVLRRFGEDAIWLDRDLARAEIASPTYHAAVWNRSGGGVLDPARLTWGLRSAALRLGVRIFEATPVQGVTGHPDFVDLSTPGGRLRSRKVLFATNAFRSPLRAMRRAVIPVWDYVLMTEPMTPSQRAAVGWRNRQGVGDARNQFHYYRLTTDDRILWGGYDAIYPYASRIRREDEQRPASFELLSRHFFETFPQLEGIRFTHRWGGPIATTTRFCLDSGSSLGGRAAWSTGYTGLGVVTSRFGARIALDALDGLDSLDSGSPGAAKLRMVRRRPLPWPPEPFRYLAVQLTRSELARADRNGGRRGPWLRLLDALRLGFDS